MSNSRAKGLKSNHGVSYLLSVTNLRLRKTKSHSINYVSVSPLTNILYMNQHYALDNVSWLGRFCIRILFVQAGWHILSATKDAGYLSSLQ